MVAANLGARAKKAKAEDEYTSFALFNFLRLHVLFIHYATPFVNIPCWYFNVLTIFKTSVLKLPAYALEQSYLLKPPRVRTI